ncbi:MAG: tyrosine-type recombinase/integrase [Streptosporangiales bacterium]|nr:tyrosine-type recombinase/integrase [Streptosporangiales bacterium]
MGLGGLEPPASSLSELRAKDLDFETRILTVSRAVVELTPDEHPEGGRFWVKAYPKDREYRRFKLATHIIHKIKLHVDNQELSEDDLLFCYQPPTQSHADDTPDPLKLDLGLTEPNEKGRQYRHGTLTAYTTGKCRCEHCRASYRAYRATRRAKGKDRPPRGVRVRETDGHIPADHWRDQIWKPAVAAAGLKFSPTFHDLRHAHASWLLAGGADLQVVKERLGHASIATTEKYLHTLPTADETALEALSKIRGARNDNAGPPAATPTENGDLDALREEIENLRLTVAKQAVALATADTA